MKYSEAPKTILDVIKQIDIIRDKIYSGKMWTDGEYMSRAVVSLAALNSFLGEHIAQAKLDENDFESTYKVELAAVQLDLIKGEKDEKGDVVKKGIAIGTAEVQAKVDTQDIWKELNQQRYMANLLATKRSDTNNLIDALRSRLSFMKAERGKS